LRTGMSYYDRMNAEFFWKMVKNEVERQQTSFEWLYRKTQIPKGTFSLWKNRNIIPRADEAYRIAEALKVSAVKLLEHVHLHSCGAEQSLKVRTAEFFCSH